MRVSANGGTPELIVKGVVFHPQLLPDGKSLLFTLGAASPYKIIVQSLQSGERKELFAGDMPDTFRLDISFTDWEIIFLLFHLISKPLKLQVGRFPWSKVYGV